MLGAGTMTVGKRKRETDRQTDGLTLMEDTLTARAHIAKWRVWGSRNQNTQVITLFLLLAPWVALDKSIKPF